MLWADRPNRRRFLSCLAVAQVAVLVATLIAPIAALAEEPPPPDQPAPPPALATDKPDYAPGEAVAVSGTGFEPGATYAIPVLRPDGTIVLGDGSFVAGWDTTTAAQDGSIAYAYQLNGIEGTYEVRAYAATWAGDVAAVPISSTTFTDSVVTWLIRGYKFEDTNANTTHQGAATEPQLAGWDIDLISGGVAVVGQTTVAGGAYSFSVPAGTYLVCEKLQSGWTQTRPYSGVNYNGFGALPCPAGQGYAPYGWSVTTGPNQFTYLNFGNYHTLLSGTKWDDLNADRIKDAGEPGVPGFTIKAYDATGTVEQASTTTDGDGNYSFIGLAPGDHVVCEVPMGSWIRSYPASSDCQAVTLVSSVDNTGNDFGNYTNATKSGFKFHDLNANGIWDDGSDESGLEGWTIVALTGADWSTVAASTTTGSNGYYEFTLPPGEFLFCEVMPDPPPAWYQSRPPSEGTWPYGGLAEECPPGYGPVGWRETLTSGASATLNNFGNYQLASKSGTIFHDRNADGIINGSDNTLPGGWTVNLVGTDGAGNAVGRTTVTDLNGLYLFDSLVPGHYTVSLVCKVASPPWRQSEPEPTNDLPASCGTGTHIIDLSSGEADTGNLFGVYHNATKWGYKFDDLNANGLLENLDGSHDPGLAGWTIVALQGGVIKSTAVTDGAGRYQLSLRPGAYMICEVTQAGWIQSRPDTGQPLFGTWAPCPEGMGLGDYGWSIDLLSGVDDPNNNFGNYQAAAKSGVAFHDKDADGTKDPGDTALVGWTVTLTGTDGKGNAVGPLVTATDGVGAYGFSSLVPGSYTIQATCPAASPGWRQSSPIPTSEAIADCGTGTHVVVLTSGQADTDNDFGFYKNATKSGVKFHDLNANGVWEEPPTVPVLEPRLAGWTITAFRLVDEAWTYYAETTTVAAQPGYSFSLRPGTYLFCEDIQPEWRQSRPFEGATSPPATWSDECGDLPNGFAEYGWRVTLNSGVNDTNNNFGNYQPASKAGVVWHDRNADRDIDPGEEGLGGWIVTLSGTDGQGNPVNRVTPTLLTGAYLFEDLNPGTYSVTVTCMPAEWRQSEPLPTSDAVADCGSGTHDIVLISNEDETGNDFGVYHNATKSGTKFHDLNGNGRWDEAEGQPTEPTLDGWTIVALTGPDWETVADSTTTGPDGFYQFSLRPGTYLVCEQMPTTTPAWYQSRPWNAGSYLFGTWTADCPTEDGYGPYGWLIELASGDSDTLNNFGNYHNATKSGTKFHDLNANGVWDESPDLEPVLGGFTITAFRWIEGAWAWYAETTTDSGDGTYQFSLKPGEYLFCEVLPAPPPTWYQSRPPGIGTWPFGGLAAECPDGYGEFGWRESLVSGGAYPLNNFGNYQNATKSGTKFHDLNANGVWDEAEGVATEPTLNDWTIAALKWVDDAWVEVATDITGPDGYYEFSLKPGEYLFCEVMPGDEWYQSRPPGIGTWPFGGLAAECPDGYGDYGWRETLVSGLDYPLNNFGNYQNATKSGYKFHDLNRNGTWNDGLGEPPLAGWKIVALTGPGWTTVAGVDYTDAEGYYEFSLTPGEYLFCEKTDGWTQSRPPGVGTWPYGGLAAECPDGYGEYGWRETLVSGEEYTLNNFGNYWDDESMFTSSSFCTLEAFRLIYHMDTPSTWRLQASNPGQFYYNVAYAGAPGSAVTLNISIPYPFVTQGAEPIQVRDFVTDIGGDGCYEFAASLGGYTVGTNAMTPTSPSGAQIIGFEDYPTKTIGSATIVTVSGIVPATGLMVVTIHLDYGLKKTAEWTRSIEVAQGGSGFPGVVINEPQPYAFAFNAGGPAIGSSSPQSDNEFKKMAGFAGILQSLSTGDPVLNGQVKIYGPTNSLIGTVYTDADGYYVLAYKHKSKSATYTIKAPAWGLVGTVTIKANGFGVVNFDTP